jgi:hypothetical protein
MKKLMLSALGALGLALSACGGSEHLSPVTEAAPRTAPAPGMESGQRFELRLRGLNAEGYSSVLVPIRSLTVTAGGRRLPVQLVARTVDLSAKDHAHLVGHFFVPEGVDRVQVALALDDFGGWEKGEQGGSLDLRGAPLRFEAPVDSLTQRGRAVVQLDVERSLVSRAHEERLLLPTLKVNY